MNAAQEKLETRFRNSGKEIFAPLKEKWLIATPEEIVRQGFICRLVNEYGYELGQMEQELQVSNSQRGQSRTRADIVIWRNEKERQDRKTVFIVVECKAEKVTIRKEDYFQGSNYATWARAKFFIATNEKETKFFKVLEEKLLLDIDEIEDIPKAKDAINEKVNDILARTKTFPKDEFQKLLFACHDVIRNNDKLSPTMAFDEILKVLFMKIHYERQKAQIFSEKCFKQLKLSDRDIHGSQADSIPFHQHLFEQIKEEFKCDEIFEEKETLRIREDSFLEIIRKLEKYNLSETSNDVKGIAFEEFLGKTSRGDFGQFFTPRTLVNFMVSVLDPQEGELIGDPCCGTGGFLIKAFGHVREKIEIDSQKNPQSRLHQLSQNCIFGMDIVPRLVRMAKINMILHGDGNSGIYHHDGLSNIDGIVEDRFDVIMANPPVGKQIFKNWKISEAVYKTSVMSSRIEVVFVERCLNLLRKGGRMGIVLPEVFLNGPDLQNVRDYIESKAKILLLVSLPPEVFISIGVAFKSSLVFLKKFTEAEETEYQQVVAEVTTAIDAKYQTEKVALYKHLKAAKGEARKELKKQERELLEKITVEIRSEVKSRFNYEFPIVQVGQAGINSTGQVTQNDLIEVQIEFAAYRAQHPLWQTQTIQYDYGFTEQDKLTKTACRVNF